MQCAVPEEKLRRLLFELLVGLLEAVYVRHGNKRNGALGGTRTLDLSLSARGGLYPTELR